MSNFLDKFKISTALTPKKPRDLSCEHVTTADFMQLGVSYYRHLVPKEKVVIDFRAFARLSAMPVPTFGRAKLNCRAFFVPFRTVMPAWNDFITDARHTFGDGTVAIPNYSPRFWMSDVVNILKSQAQQVESQSAADFQAYVGFGTSETLAYYKLYPKGRRILKVFQQLGYRINFACRASGSDHSNDFTTSALALLCLGKLYVDWYFPSAYVGAPGYDYLTGIFGLDIQDRILTADELSAICNWLYRVNYDSDYFVSAWDNPTGPNDSMASNLAIDNPDGGAGVISSDSDSSGGMIANTPHIAGTSTSVRTVTQFTIDSLKRLTDYLKRHQLAGARALDRYLARFGVNLASDKLQRSVYLGSHEIPLMTGDVMSTANTYVDDGQGNVHGNPIGAYAGKGYLAGKDGHFEFATDEYGIFFIVHSIIPQVGYVEGDDRNNYHISRLDFFTPEFDGMGTRSIASSELYLPMYHNIAAHFNNRNQIFGYTPQYAEYKVARDVLSGDYTLHSLNQAGDTSNAWHLFRLMGEPDQPIVHSESFVQGGVDDAQYNRIFYLTDQSLDHFDIHFFFGVQSFAPMKPLYDQYDFEQHGNPRVLDVNGVKMN